MSQPRKRVGEGVGEEVGRGVPQSQAAEPKPRQPVLAEVPEDRAQVELLTWLAEEGCVCCTEQLASQQRFFFWYVTENYGDVATVARVRAGLGFCPRHTRQLVGRAEPAALSNIYEQVAGAGSAMVEQTETGATGAKALAVGYVGPHDGRCCRAGQNQPGGLFPAVVESPRAGRRGGAAPLGPLARRGP